MTDREMDDLLKKAAANGNGIAAAQMTDGRAPAGVTGGDSLN